MDPARTRDAPSPKKGGGRVNTLLPLIRACAQCEQDHGTTHPADVRVSHGYCRRHSIDFLRSAGLSPERIAATLTPDAACYCPDLGPVAQEVAA